MSIKQFFLVERAVTKADGSLDWLAWREYRSYNVRDVLEDLAAYFDWAALSSVRVRAGSYFPTLGSYNVESGKWEGFKDLVELCQQSEPGAYNGHNTFDGYRWSSGSERVIDCDDNNGFGDFDQF
jgi:hypothetical protein